MLQTQSSCASRYCFHIWLDVGWLTIIIIILFKLLTKLPPRLSKCVFFSFFFLEPRLSHFNPKSINGSINRIPTRDLLRLEPGNVTMTSPNPDPPLEINPHYCKPLLVAAVDADAESAAAAVAAVK